MRYTLATDGSSDKALIYPIDWLLAQLTDEVFTPQWADLRGLPSSATALNRRIQQALAYYPCELLFVHRDAEREPMNRRIAEIQAAARPFSVPPVVCVVPVRMQEAWFLFDEAALRRAAGCPNGRMPLTMPSFATVEDIPDPKKVLYGLLRQASGLSGRRAKAFRPETAVHRLAELIENFDPLRQLPSFRALETELGNALEKLHCLSSLQRNEISAIDPP